MKNKILLLFLSIFVVANINCSEGKTKSTEVQLSEHAQFLKKVAIDEIRLYIQISKDSELEKLKQDALDTIINKIRLTEHMFRLAITPDEKEYLMSLAKKRANYVVSRVLKHAYEIYK